MCEHTRWPSAHSHSPPEWRTVRRPALHPTSSLPDFPRGLTVQSCGDRLSRACSGDLAPSQEAAVCGAPREGASHKGRLCGNGPDTNPSDRIASKHLQVGRRAEFCGSRWDSFRSCPHLSCGLISLTFTPRQSARFSSHGFGKGLSSFSGVPSQRRGGGLSVSTHLGVLPSYRRGLEEFGSQPSSQLRAMPRETANSARI